MFRTITIAAGLVVASVLVSHGALANVKPALQISDAMLVPVQTGTQQPVRRGLRAGSGSAQMTTPPAQPAAPATKTPAAAPTRRDFVRTPEQEYQDCLKLWDKGTHMTQGEWARTCRRIQNRLSTLGRNSTWVSQDRPRVQ